MKRTIVKRSTHLQPRTSIAKDRRRITTSSATSNDRRITSTTVTDRWSSLVVFMPVSIRSALTLYTILWRRQKFDGRPAPQSSNTTHFGYYKLFNCCCCCCCIPVSSDEGGAHKLLSVFSLLRGPTVASGRLEAMLRQGTTASTGLWALCRLARIPQSRYLSNLNVRR